MFFLFVTAARHRPATVTSLLRVSLLDASPQHKPQHRILPLKKTNPKKYLVTDVPDIKIPYTPVLASRHTAALEAAAPAAAPAAALAAAPAADPWIHGSIFFIMNHIFKLAVNLQKFYLDLWGGRGVDEANELGYPRVRGTVLI